jgi:excisionase family DNA binding protein
MLNQDMRISIILKIMENIKRELQQIRKFIERQNILNKEILTLEEAALYLGQSKSSIYKLTSKKVVPYYPPGGKKIYFKKSELDLWILKSRISPVEEELNKVENYLAKPLKR